MKSLKPIKFYLMKKLLLPSAFCLFINTLSVLMPILIVSTSSLFAQWTQRASLTLGPARTNACGFSIGTKGYICCGFDGTNTLDDLWEFDASSNSWTQMASIPVRRQGAVSFTIGTKAYVGTGNDTTKLRDFWMWNQANNTWIQKQNFLSTPRTEAAGFSVGAKGYIGMGNDGTNKYDLYEYDTLTNIWTQKAYHPLTGRNGCIGFSIGSKGYIASGYASGNVFKQIYEYNPSNDTWTYMGMTNIPAYGMAVCVVGNSTAFFGTGIDDNSMYYTNFSQWDPVNDTMALAPFGGTARWNAVSFSIGSSVFLGTGFDSWVTNDLWEYTTTVGVNENNPNLSIEIISNPIRDKLQFSVDNLQNGWMEVYSVKGEKIYKSSIRKAQEEINVSEYQKGIYFLKISSEGKSAVKKFVKL